MEKIARQQKNKEKRIIKADTRSDIQRFIKEADVKAVEALDDNQFYGMEFDDGKNVFSGQILPGNMWKSILANTKINE